MGVSGVVVVSVFGFFVGDADGINDSTTVGSAVV